MLRYIRQYLQPSNLIGTLFVLEEKQPNWIFCIFFRNNCCCSIDVWGIALNITLQDAPFLVFRLLIITHFNIISYMNVFFTCKNTLVILLQLYRLYVVYSENRKQDVKKDRSELTSISIISKSDMYAGKKKKHKGEKTRKLETLVVPQDSEYTEDDDFSEHINHHKKTRYAHKATFYPKTNTTILWQSVVFRLWILFYRSNQQNIHNKIVAAIRINIRFQHSNNHPWKK